MPSKCTHSGFIAIPLRHPDSRILWICHACFALKTDIQDEQITTLRESLTKITHLSEGECNTVDYCIRLAKAALVAAKGGE